MKQERLNEVLLFCYNGARGVYVVQVSNTIAGSIAYKIREKKLTYGDFLILPSLSSWRIQKVYNL